jgi:hypothetical protein
MIGRSLILLAGVLLFADARDAIAGGEAANPESHLGGGGGTVPSIYDTSEYLACKSSSGLEFVSQGKRFYHCWDDNADAVWYAVKKYGGKETDHEPLGKVRSIDAPLSVVCFRWNDRAVGRGYYISCVLAK